MVIFENTETLGNVPVVLPIGTAMKLTSLMTFHSIPRRLWLETPSHLRRQVFRSKRCQMPPALHRDQSKGLLLASSLATEDSIRRTEKRRTELVRLAESKTSPLLRNGRVASRSLRRLGAKVLGNLGEQFENSSQDPVAPLLGIVSHTRATHWDNRRTGGVLAICNG